jgi:hypothetical protein
MTSPGTTTAFGRSNSLATVFPFRRWARLSVAEVLLPGAARAQAPERF